MTDRKITTVQLNIWIITAIIGPIIFYSDGNWMGALLYSVPILMLVWIAMRFGAHWDGIIYNVLQCFWLCIVLSQFLGYSADCWPTGERTFPVVPLILLALAAATALKGSKCTAGGISVLFWFAVFLLGIVLAAGVPEMDANFLAPSQDTISLQMMLVLLLPATAGFLSGVKTEKRPFIVVVVLAVAVPMWISGILSPAIAGAVKWPFYEGAKSVQLFDVAKRLESLVSVGVTIGNYALYSLILCEIRNIGDKFQMGREAVIIASGISASLMLLKVVINPAISVVICFVLWVLLPLLGVLKRKE